MSWLLAGEADTVRFATWLAPLLAEARPRLVALRGDLGAGKTTLVRALLHALGYPGRVKSPTYTLIEPYQIGDWLICHADFYRLADPGELEYLGFDELLAEGTTCFVEWPEKAGDYLPPADLTLWLRHAGAARELTVGAATPRGERLREKMTNHFTKAR